MSSSVFNCAILAIASSAVDAASDAEPGGTSELGSAAVIKERTSSGGRQTAARCRDRDVDHDGATAASEGTTGRDA